MGRREYPCSPPRQALGSGAAEVFASILPIGELDEVQLGELAAETDVRNLADALTTWKHAFAFPLRRAIRECPRQDDPVALETALYEAFFSRAFSELVAEDVRNAPLREMLRQQVDLVNVLAALERVRDRERGATREGIRPIRGGSFRKRPCGR